MPIGSIRATLNTYFAFIPLVAIIAYLVLRNPSSAKASKSKRIDFIKQASDSIHGMRSQLMKDLHLILGDMSMRWWGRVFREKTC
jgi:hypothetical protein